VTEGVISAMKALEIAVYMNNLSTEELVRADALAREKEMLSKRIVDMEAELVASRKVSVEKDKMLAFLEKKADSTARYYQELKEARAKFSAENRALENALCDSRPGEDETEDTAVGAARHGFDNALDQLKVLNPDMEFCVDGIHFLKYVENGKIVSS